MKSKFRMLLAETTVFAGLALLFAAQNNRGQVVGQSDIGRHYGYCQVDDIRGYYELTGACVSSSYIGCYILPANPPTCGAAFPPTRVQLHTCGGIGSTLIDLARPCSFP